MMRYEEAIKRFIDYHKSIGTDLNKSNFWPPDVPPIAVMVNGEWCFVTREENTKLTVRKNIARMIQDWHSRMAVWHERRSIGLR